MAGVCALYASGRTTGVVLDSGDDVTHTVPVFEGFAIENAIKRVNLGGSDLTHYLRTMMVDKGLKVKSCDMEIVRQIKETMCFIVPDY
jgi:actin